MKALRFERDPIRFGAARVASGLRPGSGARYGPLELVDDDPPELPGPDWVRIRTRLSGICGSDLATVDGRSSRWFEPIVSFPFVPGHEVVADLPAADPVAADPVAAEPASSEPRSQRVVLEPVLGCVARGVAEPCSACAAGHLGGCELLAHGRLDAGLQTGFCCDTGGGWSTELVAHPSQLHPVPTGMADEAAVLVEPTACAVHGALRARVRPGDTVALIGAGTLGLLTLAALRRFAPEATVIIGAKHPHQRDLARELGAQVVVEADELARAVRRRTGTQVLGSHATRRLTGGAEVTIDCVGSADSLATALAVTRPTGRVVMVGMPGVLRADLTPLWQREIELVGAYAYGTEALPGPDGAPSGETARTFDLAFDLVDSAGLGRLLSATYPLERATDAIAHAAEAGRRGAVKIAFDPRT
ncbi:MAG: zinc-binding dehydrogenase [Actinobacteria bacterium]|nr:zinc-binding dehydrogenase [Actinomycetota bacterium]